MPECTRTHSGNVFMYSEEETMAERIVMIGAGNVATHISRALAAAGSPPVQVWSRSAESARILADEVGSEAVTDMNRIVADADVYIVSVADSALGDVIARLCSVCRRGVFVHTAGTMPVQLFERRAERYGVLYPMQTFSKQKELDFSIVPCFVEASDAETLAVVKRLARMLSHRVYELSGDDRRWLHVAAVFACNFANACCGMAARLLAEHGLDFSVMLPLVDETTRKLHTLAPAEAQTGPAARGDRNVMDRHLAMLKDDGDLQEVYRMMSEMIMKQKKG